MTSFVEEVSFACVLIVALVAGAAAGCNRTAVEGEGSGAVGPQATSEEITAEDLAAHTRALSDDAMLGRGPGQEGEAVTLTYLVGAFERVGLKPVGDVALPGARPGSPKYLQRVELVGITADPDSSRLSFRRSGDGPSLDLEHGRDFVTRTTIPENVVDISAGLVFAGYGIDAPTEGWNDFGDTDVFGKILLLLPGEPPVDDPDRFGGRAMTYYGRSSYKTEEAARRGAAGVLMIHSPETAGYSWEVIKGRTGERFQQPHRSVLPPAAPFEGWVAASAAARILEFAGFDLEEISAAAGEEDFAAVDLSTIATAHLDNTVRSVTSYNVVGSVEGSDPERADEHILFVAHWDHLGVGEEVDGDDIYNGAIDNAIGTAAMIEVAEAWATVEPAPRRSALFIASTAEESGFLGVVSYLENPVVPLAKTVAVINIDGVNVFGPTDDVWVVGEGLTTLEEDLEAVLKAADRHLSADPAPEEGNFFRSDHFPFAQAGIPALCVRPGLSFVGRPDGYGSEVWSTYYSTDYHRPSDEFDETWDFDATVQDTKIMFEVARRVSDADGWPRWYQGSLYKAAREAMLEAAGGR